MAGPLLSALMACSPASQAAINVDRTRIVMAANQKSMAVILTNETRTTPFLAQAWIEDANGTVTNDLLALPPLQRIDAGKKAQVRITPMNNVAASLPQDRESLFYFNVREIPPVTDNDPISNTLQLTMQSQLKLFLRPTTLAKNNDVSPEKSLQILIDDGALTLKNPTPYYVTVVWMGQDNKQMLHGFADSMMAPPFSELPLKVELPPDADQLVLGNIDDYGALRMNRYACQTGACLFQERLSE